MSVTYKPVPLTGRRVLVIEDEYFIADDIARELQSRGAEVIGPLSDLADAKELLKNDKPIDAALLDINIRNEMIFPHARLMSSRNVTNVFTTRYDKTSLASEFHDETL